MGADPKTNKNISLKNRIVTIFALFLKYTNTAAMTTNESAKI